MSERSERPRAVGGHTARVWGVGCAFYLRAPARISLVLRWTSGGKCIKPEGNTMIAAISVVVAA